VRITDAPRYGWRGAMLDVARHFFPPSDVKRYIDLMALHKLNRLHLHLSDDQGWRIEVEGWPDLTRVGGRTEVGGGPGGSYTLDEYADLVRYAEARFVTIVPEIDMPGHIHAALASYPELNCDGEPRELYTGTEVGFSALCLEKEVTWQFLEDVIREVAGLHPGPWFHVGGDEVPTLPEEDYADFMRRVSGLVQANGKTMVAWDEVAANLPGPGTVVQLWRPAPWHDPGAPPADTARARAAAEQRREILDAQARGARFIVSPASRFYLDMKASPDQVLGLRWAGVPDLRATYDWDPDTHMADLEPDGILGVEAPLWTETAGTMEDLEYLAFPRLAAVAEFGWSSRDRRDWRQFRIRLGAQSARWTALGINFRRSPLVPWDAGPTDP
jgi:hexosaminidase